jgi:hypothetical protein
MPVDSVEQRRVAVALRLSDPTNTRTCRSLEHHCDQSEEQEEPCTDENLHDQPYTGKHNFPGPGRFARRFDWSADPNGSARVDWPRHSKFGSH